MKTRLVLMIIGLVLLGGVTQTYVMPRLTSVAATVPQAVACDDPLIARIVSLPPDVEVVPPAAQVPTASAALSGVWCGRSKEGTATIVVVETVTPPTARVVYARAITRSDVPAGWWRVEAALSGGTLEVHPYPDIVLRVRVRPDGPLELSTLAGEPAVTALLGRGEGPASKPARVFEGTYITRFEVQAFHEGSRCAGRADDVWVTAAPGSEFYEQIRAYRAARPEQFPRAPFGSYRIRFIGHRSPPGHYGHLGAYQRQVTVEQILEVGPCQEG